MNKTFLTVMAMIFAKYPDAGKNPEKFTQVRFFSDGSGFIYRGSEDNVKELFFFENLQQLISHLEE